MFLELLPPAVKSYLTSPEAGDDIRLAEALLAGDQAAAESALKAAVADSGIIEPFKAILESEPVIAVLATNLIQEVQALKA